MIEMWLILAVTLTVLYLIAMLAIGPWKPNHLYLRLSLVQSPLPLPLPWLSLFTGWLLLRLIEPYPDLVK